MFMTIGFNIEYPSILYDFMICRMINQFIDLVLLQFGKFIVASIFPFLMCCSICDASYVLICPLSDRLICRFGLNCFRHEVSH